MVKNKKKPDAHHNRPLLCLDDLPTHSRAGHTVRKTARRRLPRLYTECGEKNKLIKYHDLLLFIVYRKRAIKIHTVNTEFRGGAVLTAFFPGHPEPVGPIHFNNTCPRCAQTVYNNEKQYKFYSKTVSVFFFLPPPPLHIYTSSYKNKPNVYRNIKISENVLQSQKYPLLQKNFFQKSAFLSLAIYLYYLFLRN